MSDTVQLTIKLRDYILNKFGAFLETTVEVLSKAKEYTKENMFEVLFLLLTFFWIIGMRQLFQNDPYKITTVYPATMTSISLFGFFVFVMILFFIKARKEIFKDVPNAEDNENYPSIFIFSLKVFLIGIVGYVFFNSGKRVLFKLLEQKLFTDVVEVIYDVILFSGAIALLYKVLSSKILNSFKKTKSLGLLIVNILMYLPCVITNIFEKIHNEIKITPSVTYTIILIEIIVIGLGYVVPKLITYYIEKDGVILQKEPIYLYKKTTVATATQLKPARNSLISEEQDKRNKEKYKFLSWFDTDKTDETAQNYEVTSWFGPFKPEKEVDYNYSLTSWVRINPQPPNTRANGDDFVQIFSYNGKPDIYYNPVENKIEIRVRKDNNEEVIVFGDDEFPLQKWNHFVLNFTSGTLDVFINGELVISKPGLLTRMERHPITTGDDNGVQGGIRNVMYFPYVLTKQEIDNFYKSQK